MSETRKRLGASLLACWQLPHAHPALCAGLGVPAGVVGEGRSLAVMTCDQDDTLYAALDHATKMAGGGGGVRAFVLRGERARVGAAVGGGARGAVRGGAREHRARCVCGARRAGGAVCV
jgi:ethanolamine utilization microcompartment shell protein EutL